MPSLTLLLEQMKCVFFSLLLYNTCEFDSLTLKSRFFFSLMNKQDKYKGIEFM